jgi:hypothetical protein
MSRNKEECYFEHEIFGWRNAGIGVLHILHAVSSETLCAASMCCIPMAVTIHGLIIAKNQRNNVESGLYKT